MEPNSNLLMKEMARPFLTTADGDDDDNGQLKSFVNEKNGQELYIKNIDQIYETDKLENNDEISECSQNEEVQVCQIGDICDKEEKITMNHQQTNESNQNKEGEEIKEVVKIQPIRRTSELEKINTGIFESSTWVNRTGQKKKAGVYPTKRWGHTAVVYEKFIYIYGGCGKQQDSTKTMQVFRLDCETYEWEKINCMDDIIPDSRDSHTANIIAHKMWIFGGSNSDLLFNELWTFDLQTNSWNNLTPIFKGELPSPREGHASAVIDDRYLIIIGGFNSEVEQIFQDVQFFKGG